MPHALQQIWQPRRRQCLLTASAADLSFISFDLPVVYLSSTDIGCLSISTHRDLVSVIIPHRPIWGSTRQAHEMGVHRDNVSIFHQPLAAQDYRLQLFPRDLSHDNSFVRSGVFSQSLAAGTDHFK